MEKVVIIGRGCVGATLLNNIYTVGEVYSLVDEERMKRLEDIVFNGGVLPVRTITPAASFKADFIINTVKNFSLEETLPLMEDFVGENTVIIPLQNGIESEAVIAERFGDDKVIHAFISGLSTQRSGFEVTSFTPGLITFGEVDGSVSKRVERICSYLDETKQPYRVSDDIKHDQWLKYMTNTCINSLTALMEYDYGTFVRSDSLLRAVRLVAREVQLVAAAEGITLTQDDIESRIREAVSLPPGGRTSMCDDIIAGRRTENRWFCGSLSKKAREHGMKTPYSDFLFMLLEAKSGR